MALSNLAGWGTEAKHLQSVPHAEQETNRKKNQVRAAVHAGLVISQKRNQVHAAVHVEHLTISKHAYDAKSELPDGIISGDFFAYKSR